ncbi:3-oxoacyl-ACP synthase III family protein [Kitasatospora sp. NPDC058032]|uniref:3-oxoacyl-ACP synthase III family protein n=1 Tax=Kitasatospora sp. NPDC058032 TaxID=3346307 RepID=UPI0036DEB8E7
MDAPDIHIRSVGTALPGPPVDNAAVGRRFGMDALWEQWVDAFVGTRSRHLAVDLESGERRHSLVDMGEQAARRALEAAGVDAASVDLMVFATATPDVLMPASVNLVADRLGIDDVPTYQLQSGCSGAFQALDVAYKMLLTGLHRTALVIGADTCAKHLDLSADLRSLPPTEMVNFMLFGDGAGAIVLSTEPTPGSVRLHRVLNRLTGLGRAPAQTIEWFGTADRHEKRPSSSEDYKAIEESVPVMAVEILQELLEDLDWQESDVDYLLPPQLSGQMTAKIVAELGMVDAQEVSCVRETGNNGNALPFLQLERLLPRMVQGDRALGIAIESSKWIKAGFALEKV